MPRSTQETVIAGGTIVTPDERIDRGTVRIDGGRIAAVNRSDDARSDAIDASGQYVLPGFVDLHGDDIERHVAPRSGARVPVPTAIHRADVAAISVGITTKVHAVAFEDVPDDVRSVDLAREVSDAVRTFGPDQDGLADHRLHVRCELGDASGVDAAIDEVARGATLVSMVEHVPGEGQYGDRTEPDHRYRTDGASEILGSRGDVPPETRRDRARGIATAARRAGVPLASHDDPDPAAVERACALGVDICEFPLTLETARAASRQDATVVLGAPNVARGRSLYGNLDARRALATGVVDVLCSDFRPRALLESLFVDIGSLPDRVARVTSEPADTLGFASRGRLRPGARADVILVDPDPIPTVTRAFVAGREVYSVAR